MDWFQIGKEYIKTVTDFIFVVPKSSQIVNAAINLRQLLLGRKAMTNLNSILKSKDILCQQRSA